MKFIEMKLRAPAESAKAGKIPLSMESKAVIIRVLQRFQANVPQELRSEVAVVTRLALTGHSGRFPEDIETEASDKYKEASAFHHNPLSDVWHASCIPPSHSAGQSDMIPFALPSLC